MTPAERAQLQRRFEGHLRCAERLPSRRAQHIKAAADCAKLLGFDLYGLPPAISPGMQKLAGKIRRGHATARVRETRRATTCGICQESIGSGDLHMALAGSRLCKVCAKKYAGHMGPWKRGTWFQLLP